MTLGVATAAFFVLAATDAYAASPDRGPATRATIGRAHLPPRFDHPRFLRRDFHRRAFVLGWPYGWWPDDYAGPGDAYPQAMPADYAPLPPRMTSAAPPPVCPVLLHWDDKLGHETRERLCD